MFVPVHTCEFFALSFTAVTNLLALQPSRTRELVGVSIKVHLNLYDRLYHVFYSLYIYIYHIIFPTFQIFKKPLCWRLEN